MRTPPASVCLAALLGLAACDAPPEPRGTAIRDVTVIDAASGIRDHQIVHFDGDRIVAVYDVGEERPPAAEVIDGRGRFLIPGLWDMHVHLTYDDALTQAMPAMFLYYGVTSVRDTGGMLPDLEPVVAAMRRPDAVAPRVFASGPLLDGAHVVYDGRSRPEIGIANPDVATARDNVAKLVDAGVDFIKIYELVRPPVFDALVAAARERRLPIAAHVPLSMTAGTAGPNVDSMEHLRNVELACAANAVTLAEERREKLASFDGQSGYELRSSLHQAQRLRAIENYDASRCDTVLAALQHTIQVPTLRLNAYALAPPHERDGWQAALALLPAARRDDWGTPSEARADADTTFAEWSLTLAGDMHDRDVPLAAGTDTPIARAVPGFSLHGELEMLVRAGLTPMEALAAATLVPPRFFGLGGELAAIEPGRRADLVLLNANPLENIANARRIETVVSRGRVYPRAMLESRLRGVTNPQ